MTIHTTPTLDLSLPEEVLAEIRAENAAARAHLVRVAELLAVELDADAGALSITAEFSAGKPARHEEQVTARLRRNEEDPTLETVRVDGKVVGIYVNPPGVCVPVH